MLASAGRVDPARDLEAETDEFYPFIDGLAVHGTLRPARYPPEHLRRVLSRRLAQLAAPPGRTAPDPR